MLTKSFQFLIGTLKTLYGKCPMLVSRVSIPHRYAENAEELQLKNVLNKVSIPHRYAENGLDLAHLLCFLEFQFLIGTLKTCSA